MIGRMRHRNFRQSVDSSLALCSRRALRSSPPIDPRALSLSPCNERGFGDSRAASASRSFDRGAALPHRSIDHLHLPRILAFRLWESDRLRGTQLLTGERSSAAPALPTTKPGSGRSQLERDEHATQRHTAQLAASNTILTC
jgi:hypothetical protein